MPQIALDKNENIKNVFWFVAIPKKKTEKKRKNKKERTKTKQKKQKKKKNNANAIINTYIMMSNTN